VPLQKSTCPFPETMVSGNVFIGGNEGNTLRVEHAPAVLPHHLARLRPMHMSTQTQKQQERLPTSLSKAEIEEIETQHQDPVVVYQKEQTLNACLDKWYCLLNC
jgi:hypothetical protein